MSSDEQTSAPPEIIRELERLCKRIERERAPYVEELQRIFDRHAGTELSGLDEMRRFRDAFKVACLLLDAGVSMPGGMVGTMRLYGERQDAAWTTLYSGRSRASSHAPKNTVPRFNIVTRGVTTASSTEDHPCTDPTH